MNDAIHVEVEIIKLLAIRIRPSGVHGYRGTIIHYDRLVLDHGRYDLGILGGKPPESCWNTHTCGMDVILDLRTIMMSTPVQRAVAAQNI